MSHEVYIKRTIWVAKCDLCGFSDERTDSAPRERMCFNCNKWIPFVEQSYTGPDIKGK